MHESKCASFGKLLGRLLISLVFILAGFHKFWDYEATAAYIASKGLPLVPVFLVAAALIEIFGGLALFLGFKTRFASCVLIIFLIPVTLIFHEFWNLSGVARGLQINEFLKNLSLIGGLFYILSSGPGCFCLCKKYQCN